MSTGTTTHRRRRVRLKHERGLPPEIPAEVPATPHAFRPAPRRRPKLSGPRQQRE